LGTGEGKRDVGGKKPKNPNPQQDHVLVLVWGWFFGDWEVGELNCVGGGKERSGVLGVIEGPVGSWGGRQLLVRCWTFLLNKNKKKKNKKMRAKKTKKNTKKDSIQRKKKKNKANIQVKKKKSNTQQETELKQTKEKH